MITSRDTKTGEVVIEDRPDESRTAESGGSSTVDGQNGDKCEGDSRDEVDLAVKVAPGDGRQRLFASQGFLDIA